MLWTNNELRNNAEGRLNQKQKGKQEWIIKEIDEKRKKEVNNEWLN